MTKNKSARKAVKIKKDTDWESRSASKDAGNKDNVFFINTANRRQSYTAAFFIV